jgi:hypothetical protein
MESRPYFVVGDLLANICVGVLAALVVVWIVDVDWPIPVAMLVGMVLGMLVAFVGALAVFAPLFGAIEVIVPCMLGGMLAGMTAGMWPTSIGDAAANGALAGVAALTFVYFANSLLRS